MKRVKIVLEFDEKTLPDGILPKEVFENILYNKFHVNKNSVKITDYNEYVDTKLKVCDSCHSAFFSENYKENPDDPILCDICDDYFFGE